MKNNLQVIFKKLLRLSGRGIRFIKRKLLQAYVIISFKIRDLFNKFFDWIKSVFSIREACLVVLILISLLTVGLISTQLNSAEKEVERLQNELWATQDMYLERYHEVNLLYKELTVAIEDNDILAEENEELKEQLKQTKKTTSQLKIESIRHLITVAAQESGVDPTLAIAISRYETGNWKSTLCYEHNNYGGLRDSTGWIYYPTAVEGINAFIRTLEWYNKNGMSTIDTMASTYCPDNASNWIADVKEIYNEEKN